MQLKKVIMFLLVSFACATSAQESSGVSPAGLPRADGYSHVVVAPKGRLVVISGQVALDEQA